MGPYEGLKPEKMLYLTKRSRPCKQFKLLRGGLTWLFWMSTVLQGKGVGRIELQFGEIQQVCMKRITCKSHHDQEMSNQS